MMRSIKRAATTNFPIPQKPVQNSEITEKKHFKLWALDTTEIRVVMSKDSSLKPNRKSRNPKRKNDKK